MSDPDSCRPQPAHLGVVRAHAVGNPGPVGAPTGVLELLDAPAAELGEGEVVVLGVLGEMGVEADVEALGQLGGTHHEIRGDREGRAGGQGETHHRAGVRVVVPHHQSFGFGQDLVLVHHHVVGRQPAVLLRQAHRSVGRVKSHPDVQRGADLGGDEIPPPRGCTYRWSVEVVQPPSASSARPTHADTYADSSSSLRHSG